MTMPKFDRYANPEQRCSNEARSLAKYGGTAQVTAF
jgi:hypothetical protein